MPEKFKLTDGEAVANFLLRQLEPYCDRAIVAGSIRRQRPEVHDIDLVVIPRISMMEVGLPGFGPTKPVNLLITYLQAGHFWCQDLSGGGKIQRFTCAWNGLEIPVDVYLADKNIWPTLLLIRTGSAAHNIYLCRKAQQLGLQLKADGAGLLDVERSRYLPVKTEADIFTQLGVPWREPREREA